VLIRKTLRRREISSETATTKEIISIDDAVERLEMGRFAWSLEAMQQDRRSLFGVLQSALRGR